MQLPPDDDVDVAVCGKKIDWTEGLNIEQEQQHRVEVDSSI